MPVRGSRGRDGSRAHVAAPPPLLLRHPRWALVASLLAAAALGFVGLHVEEELSPTTLDVPGTRAAEANEMLRERFGDTAPFAILLRGPAAAIDRQGPALVRALRRNPDVTTLSPWDVGSVQRLRPGPRRALVLADFHTGITEAVNESVPELNGVLERQIRPPVRATQSGFATLSRAIQDESIAATERGELIALPILLVVLLLVFRSLVAAAIPLLFGALTVVAARGLLSISTGWFEVDAFALTVTTMMGLALGVDYTLLMVSRFREELAGGAAPPAAARATRRTAGRTTAFAGSTLLLSMLVSIFILPGSLLASLAATVAMVVALSVLVATVAGPALLTLLGPNVNRWRIGPTRDGERSRLMTLVGAALRRPAPVAAAIGAVLLLLAAPAIALKTGPPSPEQLAPDDPARLDAELIAGAIGPGWDAPFVVVAATDRGTIAAPARLRALTRWQREVAGLPGVQAVIGPAQVSRAVTPLRRAGDLLAAGGGAGPLADLDLLGDNLGRAADGVAQLRGGISQASYGAGLLAEGSGRVEEGAAALAAGLDRAGAGSDRAVGALETFAAAAQRLAGAQHRAAIGTLQLKFAVRDLGVNLRRNALPRSQRAQKSLNEDSKRKLPQLEGPAQVADAQLRTALRELEGMTDGRSDPHYEAALAAVRQALAAVSGADPVSGAPYAPGYAGLPAELAALRNRLLADAQEVRDVTAWVVTAISGLRRMTTAVTQLSDGLNRLDRAGRGGVRGSARLARAAAGLSEGLSRLGAGADALAGGVSRLTGGAAALQESLAEGFHRSRPLETGLERATVQVLSGSARLDRQARRLRRTTPGIFDSGYFVLSALDGARPRVRERAAAAIDLDGGGQAATMLVVSRYTFNSPGSISLHRRLEGEAADLAREAGVATGVAGGAAQLNDYSDVTRSRIPIVIAAVTLATFLVLVLVLRSLPLAAIAVGLNLATVAVAFGVLVLLFEVPESWPLGGRSYVDAVGATAIFGVVFGLSIDYAVFLLMRMREHYDREGDTAAAIEFGLQRTARVITGAAAIMMAVFVAFAGAPIATVSQLGVGLTVAVLLDATVVRIVLLPALMLLLGDRVWWLPRPLQRALPRLNV